MLSSLKVCTYTQQDFYLIANASVVAGSLVESNTHHVCYVSYRGINAILYSNIKFVIVSLITKSSKQKKIINI